MLLAAPTSKCTHVWEQMTPALSPCRGFYCLLTVSCKEQHSYSLCHCDRDEEKLALADHYACILHVLKFAFYDNLMWRGIIMTNSISPDCIFLVKNTFKLELVIKDKRIGLSI